MSWESVSAKGRSPLQWFGAKEADENRFCNFMHLCHPTKSLVSGLQASQRVSRRRKAANGNTEVSGDMGWTPASAADGPGTWQPRNGEGAGTGEGGWNPNRR